MATDNESFNRDLYDLLKVRGYEPVPLDSKNQRVPASQAADVIQFTFTKDGEEYGKAWVSIDDAANVIVYYDEEQQESPSNATPGVEYNDSWTGFLKHLKNWAQRRQLSFELSNKDRLGDDMRQRDYYKMKERVSEGYYPMGKKASYNDAVPNVKIVLQHNRALEEGEQRYRNVAKIYLENVDGERFLAPTTRPGIARVYARHIAEGGVPNDDRWNHIKSICEDYNKMAGFVRATRNGQFNESATQMVQEGVNHYNNLRETLHKLTGHRGYQAYFESWTPSLMEDEGDDSINELFVQETMDPRIESAMPILSRLKKPVTEMEEIDTLAEWADSVINEKLELDEGDVVPFKKKQDDDLDDDDDDSWMPSEEDFEQEEKHRNRKRTPANDVNEMEKDLYQGSRHDPRKGPPGPDKTAKMLAAKKAMKDARKTLDKAFKGDIEENFIGMSPQAVAEEEVEESGLQAYLGKKKYGEKGMKALQQAGREGASKEKMASIRAKHDKLDEEEVEEGILHRGAAWLAKKLSSFAGYQALKPGKYIVPPLEPKGGKPIAVIISGEKVSFPNLDMSGREQNEFNYKRLYDHIKAHIQSGNYEAAPSAMQRDYSQKMMPKKEVEEDLDANQKRAGQLGPTEKVKNNNIGKLVGANESTEIDPELARIMEMARFKR
jgi:hypothetical protein